MAINAPIIRPDPVGNYLESFKTFDTSNRDRMRLEMEQRRMEVQAVQQARENKANDFKLMLAATGRQEDLQQRAIDNDLRRQQMGISQYGAETSRYNATTSRYEAFNPRSRSGRGYATPVGFGSGVGSTPSAPAPVTDLTLPGDPEMGESPLPPADASTYLMPPPGGDISGVEGMPDAPAMAAPLIDESAPVQDQSPDLFPSALMPPPMAPADNTPAASPPAYLPAPLEALFPPAPSAPVSSAPSASEFIGPIQTVPSLGAAPIDQGLNNTLMELKKGELKLKQEAETAEYNAKFIQRQLPRVDPAEVPAGIAKSLEFETEAAKKQGEMAEAKARAAQTEVQKKLLTTRQTTLRSLSTLDSILPQEDRARLLAQVGDPTSSAGDDILKDLSVYDKIRRTRSPRLDHNSNGIETARNVAIAGANLETKEAQSDRAANNTFNTLNTELATLEKKPDAERTDSEKEEIKALRSERIKSLTGARAWESRQRSFDDAVKADIRPDTFDLGDPAPVKYAPEVKITPLDPPPVAPKKYTLSSEEVPKAKQMSDLLWTTIKDKAAPVLDDMSDSMIRAVASGGRPTTPGSGAGAAASGGFGMSGMGAAVPSGKRYSQDIAEKEFAGMQMPTHYDTPSVSGRKEPLTMEDALVAAAKDRVAEMDRKAKGGASVSEASRAKAAAIKI